VLYRVPWRLHVTFQVYALKTMRCTIRFLGTRRPTNIVIYVLREVTRKKNICETMSVGNPFVRETIVTCTGYHIKYFNLSITFNTLIIYPLIYLIHF